MSSISALSGIDTSYAVTAAATATKTTTQEDVDKAESGVEDVAAVYEKSKETETDSTKKTYTQNTALVEQLKADAQKQTENLRNIVEKLISGQGNAYALANYDEEDEDSIWKIFANGDFENVDEAAVAQAKEDIADGGYYSVEETASRILDFAKALTGGDPDKIDTMLDAFKQGYEEATKSWGKDLPEISSKTYDAVLQGFEDWRSESAES